LDRYKSFELERDLLLPPCLIPGGITVNELNKLFVHQVQKILAFLRLTWQIFADNQLYPFPELSMIENILVGTPRTAHDFYIWVIG
jgi:hypothetical protein